MVFDFAITVGGNPVDLTDAGLWFTAKTSPTSTAAVFQKTLGQGITVTDPANGAGMIALAPGDTSGLATRQLQLYFDLELETGGAVFTVAAGKLVVIPDVTVRP